MSHLPGNPHYEDAAAAGKYYDNRSLPNDADVIAMAQVEATLALAYEQRTANYIALLNYVDRHNAPMPYEAYTAARDQIIARLGLDK